MYLTRENEMQSTREKCKKEQNENDVVIPRQAGKRIMLSELSGDILRHCRIDNGTKLDDANHCSEQDHDDA